MHRIGRRPGTLPVLFEKALGRHAGRTAVVGDERTLSYAELDDRSASLAAALGERGVAPGDHVGIVMRNRPEHAVVDVAVVRSGAVRVALNPMLSGDELAYALDDADVTAVLVGPEHAATIASLDDRTAPDVQVVVADGRAVPDGFERYESLLEPDRPAPAVEVDPADAAAIYYTGGTTGRPKGVVYTHDSLVANVLAIPLELDLSCDDRALLATPLSHSAGAFLWASLAVGATVEVTAEFDPGATLDRFGTDVTWTFLVPTMLYRLLDHPAAGDADAPALDTLVYGAAPMRADRLREGLRTFGPVFVQFYGQTEVPNLITTLGKQEHRRAVEESREDVLSSAGRPCLLTDVGVVGPNGDPLPSGETGEVVAAAPYAFREYYGRPEATAETVRNGRVYTGDVGFFDDEGYLHLVDRKADVVITGGMNVYSRAVEDVLADHPSVAEVAVVGVPDPDWGEAVVAAVVPADPDLTPEAVRAYADEHLADYKKPKRVEIVASLPRSPYGKIDKSALRDQHR